MFIKTNKANRTLMTRITLIFADFSFRINPRYQRHPRSIKLKKIYLVIENNQEKNYHD